MIISPFWLRIRWTADFPSEEFEVVVANLEAVALRFRFRFVATQPGGGGDCTTSLRDHVDPLTNYQGPATLLAKQDWTRNGQIYATRWDVQIGPGETHRTGIASVKPMDVPGMFTPDVLDAGGVLRGHWELSLPALTAPAGAALAAAQLDHPARVLVAAFRRSFRNKDGHVTHDAALAMPLAGGDAERVIAPDAPTRTTITSSTAIALAKRRQAKPKARR